MSGQAAKIVQAPTASDRLLFALDLMGTAVFAVEGTTRGIGAHLDIFGVLVLAFCTALGGGVIRDVLIGAVPVAALRDWRYPVVAFVAGGIAFLMYGLITRIPSMLLTTLDAAGLALFAVAGAEKALMFGMHGFIAVLLGTITGVGGGTVRDLLLAQVPGILRVDVYATAAMAGATMLVIGLRLRLSPAEAAILGAAACFALRMIAVLRHWNLPHAA
jgi:uncharacterized membrane protein YeiH